MSATLTLLDETLCGFGRWAQGREVRSALYLESNDLNPAQRSRLRAEIERMREVLARCRDSFDLVGERRSAANDIWGRAAAARVHLLDLADGQARRYGEVPPGAARELVEQSSRLLDGLDRIIRIVAP